MHTKSSVRAWAGPFFWLASGLMLNLAGVFDALAADQLGRARKLVAQTRAFPELNNINEQIAAVIGRLDTATAKVAQYRKEKVKARDARYSALTREFNQTRTRIAELERKLQRPQMLDPLRLPPPPDSPKGSPAHDAWLNVVADEKKRLAAAQDQCRDALKALAAHYDSQLAAIAGVRY